MERATADIESVVHALERYDRHAGRTFGVVHEIAFSIPGKTVANAFAAKPLLQSHAIHDRIPVRLESAGKHLGSAK
jgi:hypothetical protein